MVKIIFGLGNPGKKYVKTRHNLGFWVVDELAERYQVKASRKSLQSIWGEGLVLSKKIVLVKPLTFMNLSGACVKLHLKKFNAKPSGAFVVCDDINLEPGKLRIRKGGSSGGHNGLKSIEEQINTQDFPRLRIGVGLPPEGIDSADYVTDTFSRHEWKFYEEIIKKAADAVEEAIEAGVDAAMNKYN